MQKKIYLDNAATTRPRPEVFDAMLPYFGEIYGNSNSLHNFGRTALAAVDNARKTIADLLGADAGEIYFTSGGTEANNWALRGVSEILAHRGRHIIVSSIEHPSILDTAAELARAGFSVDYIKVDSSGVIDFEHLKSLVRSDTVLVSVMLVNNEVGTIQDIKKIGEFLRSKKILFHTDAVQALSSIKINVKDMNVDYLSCSSHKVYGPKGVGALYIRSGAPIKKLISGGEQEKSKRGGTTNVPAVVGFGKAVEILSKNFDSEYKKVAGISRYFIKTIKEQIGDIIFNSPTAGSVPGIINISFKGIEGESILLLLDFDNIAVSTGSACASGSLQKSHVLKAMGQSAELINGAVRFSFDSSITKEDIDFVIKKLSEVVKRLRSMSPLV